MTDESVSELGLPMPGASGRTQPGHHCDRPLDGNEWFGRDRMLKRVQPNAATVLKPWNASHIARV